MKVDDTAENAERCVCPTCPTYNDCMRSAGQLMFCARGKSSCEVQPVSCKCGSCTVWAQFDLNDYYYCVSGAAS